MLTLINVDSFCFQLNNISLSTATHQIVFYGQLMQSYNEVLKYTSSKENYQKRRTKKLRLFNFEVSAHYDNFHNIGKRNSTGEWRNKILFRILKI